MSDQSVRIAMWSGPRNISTAMMRSWGSRADTFVCDEPLYAHYLKATGVDHPGREEVLRHHDSDWRTVVGWLTGPVPDGKRIFYQKHMTHHLLPNIDLEWIGGLTNVFLIRDPAAMLVSLAKSLGRTPALPETGLPQQCLLFKRLADESGDPPPVLDSADVLKEPQCVLRRLCEMIGVDWDDAMLRWAPGPRATDGVWAKHWYASVEASTGFTPHEEKAVALPEALAGLHDACRDLYNHLHDHRIV